MSQSTASAKSGAAPTAVRVAVLAYDGVDDLDLFGSFAVLSKASDVTIDGTSRLSTGMVAATGEIITAAGIRCTIERPLDWAQTATALVLPGGRGVDRAVANPDLLGMIRTAAAGGTLLYGICSGSLLLAAAGLGQGRRLAIHHRKQALLARHPGSVPARGLIRQGRVCTVGGEPGASVKSVDMAFQILADLCGDTVSTVQERLETWPGRSLPPQPLSEAKPSSGVQR